MGSLLTAFEATIAGNKNIELVDDAIVESGRSIARAIDQITADPDASATDKTKALYLTPHLVAILRELLATPAARKTFGIAAAEQKAASRLTLIKGEAKKSTSA